MWREWSKVKGEGFVNVDVEVIEMDISDVKVFVLEIKVITEEFGRKQFGDLYK